MRNFKEKICVICSNSYKPTTGKQYACSRCSKVYWRIKHAEQAKARGRLRKLKGIEYLGGKCMKCNNTFHPSIYEFHHKNPLEKDKQPSSALQQSWKNFKMELDKCDLLCANCHRFEHHNWELSCGV